MPTIKKYLVAYERTSDQKKVVTEGYHRILLTHVLYLRDCSATHAIVNLVIASRFTIQRSLDSDQEGASAASAICTDAFTNRWQRSTLKGGNEAEVRAGKSPIAQANAHGAQSAHICLLYYCRWRNKSDELVGAVNSTQSPHSCAPRGDGNTFPIMANTGTSRARLERLFQV